MYAGYDAVEDYELDIYGLGSESGSESDDNIENELYQQIHYAQEGQTSQDQSQDQDHVRTEYTFSESTTKTEKDCKDLALKTTQNKETKDREDSIVASKTAPKKRILETISLITSDSDSVTCIADFPAKKVKLDSPQEDKSKTDGMKINTTSSKKRKTVEVTENQSEEETDDMSVIWLSDSSNESEPEWTLIDTLDNTDDKDLLTNLVGVRSQRESQEHDTETGTPSNEVWNISSEDLVNDIQNSEGRSRPIRPRRYYASKSSIRCFNCGNNGHMSSNCPNPKKADICYLCAEKGHRGTRCPKQVCWQCREIGHPRRFCWQKGSVRCTRCQRDGHLTKDCPDRWRQFHATTNANMIKSILLPTNKRVFCYNCAKKGHFGHECVKNRMEKQLVPTIPFVIKYDAWRDIENRFDQLRKHMNLEKNQERDRRRNTHIMFQDDVEEEETYRKKRKKSDSEFYKKDKKRSKYDKKSQLKTEKVKNKEKKKNRDTPTPKKNKKKKNKNNYELQNYSDNDDGTYKKSYRKKGRQKNNFHDNKFKHNQMSKEKFTAPHKITVHVKNNFYNKKHHSNVSYEDDYFPRSKISKVNNSHGWRKGHEKEEYQKSKAKKMKKWKGGNDTKVFVSKRGFHKSGYY
ncbi:zinc finger CCHC domain-containing protein 7-like [Glandiceps talaboti]